MKKGFTLIELLVVMFIIAILASLVIVNVNGSRKTARDSKRIANLKAIQGSLEQYYNQKGSYPKTATSWNGNRFNGGIAGCRSYVYSGVDYGQGWCGITSTFGSKIDWIPGLSPTYISVLPSDPKTVDFGGGGGIGGYVYASDGNDYLLMAYGTMETLCGDASTLNVPDPHATCNPTSMQEMARPWTRGATVGSVQPTIAVFTPGAVEVTDGVYTGWYIQGLKYQ
ncbi:MAG: type II secretion system protein [Patescibacteria group bacterium]